MLIVVFIGASSVVAATSTSCGIPVKLPKFNISATCPDDSQYWLMQPFQRQLLEAPDCHHDVGFQFLQNKFLRHDFNSHGEVVGGASYMAKFFSAAPDAIMPTVMTGRLLRVSAAFPSTHKIEGTTYEGELNFHFKGEVEARVSLLLASHTSAKTPSVVAWLLEDGRMPTCSWWQWLTSWFFCPARDAQVLHLRDFMAGRRLSLHYHESNCGEIFVLPKPIEIVEHHMSALRKSTLALEDSNAEGVGWKSAIAVSIADALLPINTFTVFSASEIWHRKVFFGIAFALGFAMIILCYFCTKCICERSGYEPVLEDLLSPKKNPSLHMAMLIDHWLSYIVAILVAFMAYRLGILNRRTGSPWEYHSIFAAWLAGHCLHEIFWLWKCGTWLRRISYFKLIKCPMSGVAGELDFFLDCQFIAIARMFGSNLAYWSAGVFFVSNIVGQLFLFTVAATICEDSSKRGALFKPRGMEVLHVVTTSEIDTLSDDERMGPKLFVGIKFFFEDVSQAVIQILFCFWYGGSPIVFASVVVSLSLSAYTLFETCSPA